MSNVVPVPDGIKLREDVYLCCKTEGNLVELEPTPEQRERRISTLNCKECGRNHYRFKAEGIDQKVLDDIKARFNSIPKGEDK